MDHGASDTNARERLEVEVGFPAAPDSGERVSEGESGGDAPENGELEIDAGEGASAEVEPIGTATYDPADNRIRLSFPSRLDAATYERVKKAGFRWAPKQGVFFAPQWTPQAEDVAFALCGRIGDEDTSLAERAEVRAERFEDYSERRAAEAHRAKAEVDRVGERFAGGQPILVGHHSERRARKDKEKIDRGMRKAVALWETSTYWTDRAAGAIRAAKYKELPAVRHRRIGDLESKLRKHTKVIEGARELAEKVWSKPALPYAVARKFANFDHVSFPVAPGETYGRSIWDVLRAVEEGTDEEKAEAVARVSARARDVHAETIAHHGRWASHLENRLAYERAMLGEQGGIRAEKFALAVGGRILGTHYTLRGKGWAVITKITKGAEGHVVSVSTPQGVCPIETVTDYREPTEGDAEAVKAATKLPPMVNRPWGPEPPETWHARGTSQRTPEEREREASYAWHMTKAEWAKIYKDSKGSSVAGATETHGAYRYRVVYRRGAQLPVFLTDEKTHELPKPASATAPTTKAPGIAKAKRGKVNAIDRPSAPPAPPAPTTDSDAPTEPAPPPAPAPAPSILAPVVDDEVIRRELASHERRAEAKDARALRAAEAAPFDALKASLAAGGVHVVVAPELFPTPAALATELVATLRLRQGARVLEPSAGTGALVRAALAAGAGDVVAVERNTAAVKVLRAIPTEKGQHVAVFARDFLDCTVSDLGTFEGIAMNPPFSTEILHVEHALDLLVHGGRLAAIMSAGVEFREDRKHLAFRARILALGGTIRRLPAGSFLPQTSVNTVLVTVTKGG